VVTGATLDEVRGGLRTDLPWRVEASGGGGDFGDDLIVTLDDATSEISSAFFVAEEGTMSTFRALAEVIARHGLICALYADRGSHSWPTAAAGGKVDKDNPTQVGALTARHRADRDLLAGRPAAARSGCSQPCRTACRRSLGSPASPAWPRPVAFLPTPDLWI
jgi:hypothetical protein